MTTTRNALLVLAVLGGLLGCDDQPPPEEDVVVSAAVAANEYPVWMMFPGDPPKGSAPDAGQDCQGAYEWAHDNGAFMEGQLLLRAIFRVSRYTQVDRKSLSVRVVGRSEFDSRGSMFICGDSVDDRQRPPEVDLPPDVSEVEFPLLPFEEPLSSVGLAAGETSSFLLQVSVPNGGGLTRFEVVLRADLNGVARTFVLRDGDDPFTLLSNHPGAGFSPRVYFWCPGSPGRLVNRSGDDNPLDTCAT